MNRILDYVVPQESDEYSITDIPCTLLRFCEKKLGLPKGKFIAGALGTDIKFFSLYDIMGMDGFHGASLEEVISGRSGYELESFHKIIIFLIDGMSFQTFFKSGKNFWEKNNPELIPMYTTFPSMTTVATTSLLTGAFPSAHGIVSDVFYDAYDEKVFKIKPYLTEDSKLYLPRIVPVTTHFLLSQNWDKNKHTLEFISSGASHSQTSERRFLDYFFSDEFDIGGRYIKKCTNEEAFLEALESLNRNANKEILILFIRFSVDYLAHLFGPTSPETILELNKILSYITELNKFMDENYSKNSTLIFLTTDHGHKELSEGFVPLSIFQRYLPEDINYIATNQTLVSLYKTYAHMWQLKTSAPSRLIRVKKKGSRFYTFDPTTEKWMILRKCIDSIPSIPLSKSRFGVGDHIGSWIIYSENFYFGFRDQEYYRVHNPNFLNFKSSHGGPSNQECYIPSFFWVT